MKIYTDFNLTNFNSYRIKAHCKTAFLPENEKDIIELYKKLDSYLLIGSGHNIILAKEYYDTNFVIFNGNYNNIIIDNKKGIIEAESGATMLEISELALLNSLSGLEIFYDIPSSLGGAVVMNAGASGEEIKDVLLKVRYLDLADMQVKEISKKEIEFEYRNSFFQRNTDKVVLKVWLQLKKGDAVTIKEKMENIKTQRWVKQPREFPNGGSVYKRPKGMYVGPMLEELNLKGFTIGGAQVSEKHSGFIINIGSATGEDILNLIKHIQKRVLDSFKVNLVVEQRIIQ